MLIVEVPLMLNVPNSFILLSNLAFDLRNLLINRELVLFRSVVVANLRQESSGIDNLQIGCDASKVMLPSHLHALLVSFQQDCLRKYGLDQNLDSRVRILR